MSYCAASGRLAGFGVPNVLADPTLELRDNKSAHPVE
jgi:hypothetical protein